jgi:hypothetical protein
LHEGVVVVVAIETRKERNVEEVRDFFNALLLFLFLFLLARRRSFSPSARRDERRRKGFVRSE